MRRKQGGRKWMEVAEGETEAGGGCCTHLGSPSNGVEGCVCFPVLALSPALLLQPLSTEPELGGGGPVRERARGMLEQARLAARQGEL